MRLSVRFVSCLLPAVLLLAACEPERWVAPIQVKRYQIAAERAPCLLWTGGTGSCVQFRTSPDGAWQHLYGGIDGFTPTEGTRYLIEVEEIRDPDPPMDGSNIALRLRRIIEAVIEAP